MKKILTVLAAVAFLATVATAQEEGAAKGGSGIALTAEVGLSYFLEDVGDADALTFPVIGIKGMYELANVKVGANPMGVGGYIAYNSLVSEDYYTFSAIPVLAMVELRPIEIPLFIDVGLGLGFWSSETDFGGYFGKVETSGTAIAFMPRVGYAIPVAGFEVPITLSYLWMNDDGSMSDLNFTAGFTYKF